jgi:hypothetical protein
VSGKNSKMVEIIRTWLNATIDSGGSWIHHSVRGSPPWVSLRSLDQRGNARIELLRAEEIQASSRSDRAYESRDTGTTFFRWNEIILRPTATKECNFVCAHQY